AGSSTRTGAPAAPASPSHCRCTRTMPPADPATILVADDEESIRWVLERALAQRGYTVRTVATGTAALEALKAGGVDVALVDIRMPDVSGLDVLQQARDGGVDTLFVIMTAQNTMV